MSRKRWVREQLREWGAAVLLAALLLLLLFAFPRLGPWLVALLSVGLCLAPVVAILVIDGKAARAGMARRSTRRWRVRVVTLPGACRSFTEALHIECSGCVTRLVALDAIAAATYAYDDSWEPPDHLEDAVMLELGDQRIKIPASADGFGELLAVLDRDGRLARVRVEAFAWWG